jgi:queuine tRNA-ribosyltransferase
MKFTLIGNDTASRARAGMLHTSHGAVHTPIFMPVGTAVHQRELETDIGAEIILANTYHLYLRPGIELLQKAGGIHKFNGWSRPMLTDSGGYQVYSLADNRKISEEGVAFKSHIDGSKHYFTPESVIDIERDIGADIIMALDECTPYPCDQTYAAKSMDMTHRWLTRCVTRMNETSPRYGYDQSLFPIIQGSTYRDLRIRSAEFVAGLNLDGNAIGGLSVGEPHELMYEMTSEVCGILPVMPTRNARNGMLFTSEGIINIRNEKWKDDLTPIDPALGGYASTFYSKAYLRHLVISKEILGAQIATIHNLTFYLWLVKEARKKIMDGIFSGWKEAMVKKVTQRL